MNGLKSEGGQLLGGITNAENVCEGFSSLYKFYFPALICFSVIYTPG